MRRSEDKRKPFVYERKNGSHKRMTRLDRNNYLPFPLVAVRLYGGEAAHVINFPPPPPPSFSSLRSFRGISVIIKFDCEKVDTLTG